MPNTSSLDVLHDAFESLIDGPCPYSIDGRTIDGLPDRPVPAGELRDLLPHLDGGVRDEIWRELVRRARTRCEAWTVIAAGLALPGGGRTTRTPPTTRHSRPATSTSSGPNR